MNLSTNIKGVFSTTRGYFLLCLSSIAIGLSVSKPLMALGLFGLLIVWLVDGNLKQKIKAFWSNKIAVIISSIYILTVLGLIYTSNYDFAIDDLRRKLPLFFLPFYISGFSPLTKKELYLLLKIYIVGVLIATFWSLFVYFGGLETIIVDKRQLSRFNSHIRFGLEIALALFFSFHFFSKSNTIKSKLLWVGISLWFLFSLYILGLFSGAIVFLITLILLLMVFGLFISNKKIKRILIASFLFAFVGAYLLINQSITNFYTCNQVTPLKEIPLTKEGNKYQKDAYTNNSTIKENGYYVERNIAWEEFTNAWNKRSKISFNDKDLKGQEIKYTLIRFITSKGQRKDKNAIDNLTPEEIKAIENGIANVKYLNMNFLSIRMHKIIWEYNSYLNGRNINGHSVLMRWEFWKTAIHIIKNNPIIGVGTGDVQDAFNLQYEKDNSSLTPKYRLRAHNQYLTYGVTFGIVGMLWFVGCLFYPMIKTKQYTVFIYLAFFSIALLSMLTEDTLETQAGINFFAFFNTILLLGVRDEKS